MPLRISTSWSKIKDNELTPQQRGFKFEKIIESILKNEGLKPKASYKPKGEQIDGSFYWNGQVFLLEAKWTKEPIPASSIYAFKGKLDGKFHTTSGVFLSMGGYGKDVEDTLRTGKSLNIILFLPEDIELFCSGKVKFIEILEFKLREAGDTGKVAVPYKLKEKVSKLIKSKPISKKDEFEGIDFLVISESKKDKIFINKYLEPIIGTFEYSYKIIDIESINGINQIPSFISIYMDSVDLKGIILFVERELYNVNSIKQIHYEIENSSIYTRIKIINFDNKLKQYVELNELKDWNDVFDKKEFQEILNFFRSIKEEYEYDPIQAPVNEAIENTINNIKWNYQIRKAIIPSELKYHPDNEYFNVDDLVDALNEIVTSEATSSYPLDYLKEGEFYYDLDIREYLLENKEKELKRIGWLDNV